MSLDHTSPPVLRSSKRRYHDSSMLVNKLLTLGVDIYAARIAAALDRLVPVGTSTTGVDNHMIARECPYQTNIRAVQEALKKLKEVGVVEIVPQQRGESHRVITLLWRVPKEINIS